MVMMSVAEAAGELGVTPARVRAMLAGGQLDGEKIGRAWAVSGASVRRRKREGAHPGRPSKKDLRSFDRLCPDAEDAHRLYDEARLMLAGCYSAEFLSQARDADEQAFWILVADFFLQRRQRELIDEGVF